VYRLSGRRSLALIPFTHTHFRSSVLVLVQTSPLPLSPLLSLKHKRERMRKREGCPTQLTLFLYVSFRTRTERDRERASARAASPRISAARSRAPARFCRLCSLWSSFSRSRSCCFFSWYYRKRCGPASALLPVSRSRALRHLAFASYYGEVTAD